MNNLLHHAIQPQDEAFDAFRALFALLCADVSSNGLKMSYRGSAEFAQKYLLIAQTIIIANQLPLEARRYANDIVVEFVAAESFLPCY